MNKIITDNMIFEEEITESGDTLLTTYKWCMRCKRFTTQRGLFTKDAILPTTCSVLVWDPNKIDWQCEKCEGKINEYENMIKKRVNSKSVSLRDTIN